MRRVWRGLQGAVACALLSGCAATDRLQSVDTRAENVDHQRINPRAGGVGASAIEEYRLGPTEAYRMPQLHTAPPPVLGDADPRRELAPTRICLQLVVDAAGNVERSLPLTDRADCDAGKAAVNAALVTAAQQAVAQWRFSPAALCHFEAGKKPRNEGDCEGADRIEPIPVSLLYAFTFEIVKGRQSVRRDGGD